MFDLSPDVLRALPVWFVATLFSVTLHEAAHALAGRWGGDDTASEQVTLDPTPHIKRSPFGMILVPILSFFFNHGRWMIAFASAPFDPRWAARYPKRAALMALAGPAANLLLCGIAIAALHVGIAAWGWQAGGVMFDDVVVTASGESDAATMFVSVLFSTNLLLGLFNLLPVAPLDGHAVVPLFLSERLTQKWHELFMDRGAAMIGLVVAWVVFGRIAYPAFRIARDLVVP